MWLRFRRSRQMLRTGNRRGTKIIQMAFCYSHALDVGGPKKIEIEIRPFMRIFLCVFHFFICVRVYNIWSSTQSSKQSKSPCPMGGVASCSIFIAQFCDNIVIFFSNLYLIWIYIIIMIFLVHKSSFKLMIVCFPSFPCWSSWNFNYRSRSSYRRLSWITDGFLWSLASH